MEKCIYHQSRNTNTVLITSFPYDRNDREINSLHFHRNFEILVAVEGSFKCSIDNQNYLIKKGQAVLIQPFQIHNLKVSDNSLVWCSTFSDRFFKSIATALDGKRARSPVFHPDSVVTEFYVDRMDKYIGRRKELTSDKISKIQENTFKSCVYAMGSSFLEQCELVEIPRKNELLASDMVQYVEKNFRENITLEKISKELGYNYQYLSKVFNQTFGMSFKQMLNRYRLEHAISMLAETDMSIAQIALESGFQSMRSFDLVCREIFGKTPMEIKREIKEKK